MTDEQGAHQTSGEAWVPLPEDWAGRVPPPRLTPSFDVEMARWPVLRWLERVYGIRP